jgi:hypothetical protein
VLAPLVALIIALALWPGLILERGQDAVTEKVGAVALADCGIEGAYINRSVGADQTAELVTAGREGCTQQYGVSPIEAISATLPCGTTQAQGAGYLIKFCDDMTALR